MKHIILVPSTTPTDNTFATVSRDRGLIKGHYVAHTEGNFENFLNALENIKEGALVARELEGEEYRQLFPSEGIAVPMIKALKTALIEEMTFVGWGFSITSAYTELTLRNTAITGKLEESEHCLRIGITYRAGGEEWTQLNRLEQLPQFLKELHISINKATK